MGRRGAEENIDSEALKGIRERQESGFKST